MKSLTNNLKQIKMKISVDARMWKAELSIQSANTTINEDLSEGTESLEIIDQLIQASNELSLFNHISDVDFVKKIYDKFLTDSEKVIFKLISK